MIQSSMLFVGCGAATCDSSTTYAYCNYAFGQGNIENPYISGASCSMCASSNCTGKIILKIIVEYF